MTRVRNIALFPSERLASAELNCIRKTHIKTVTVFIRLLQAIGTEITCIRT